MAVSVRRAKSTAGVKRHHRHYHLNISGGLECLTRKVKEKCEDQYSDQSEKVVVPPEQRRLAFSYALTPTA